MILLPHCLVASIGLAFQGDREHLHLPSSVPVPEPVAGLATTFEGIVRGADGAPASGAIVFSDAGGMAVAGADGSFRLSVQLPLDAANVRLTAMDRGAERAVGSVSLVLPGAGGAVPAGVLQLAAGTCAPSWLPSFGVLPGVANVVRALTVFDDGSGPVLVVGGELSVASGNPVSNVAAWDGSSWSDLGGGAINTVRALAVFDDGLGGGPALYVAGDFIGVAAGTLAANRIAKWDGEEWQALGTGLSAPVLSLTVFDGDLYAGGNFLQAGSLVVNRVARWTGTAWEALGAGLGAPVSDLAAFDDGLGGGPALHAAVGSGLWKWNGAAWASLSTGITSGAITELVAFDDGGGDDLYLGGTFVQTGGAQARGIARWNGTSLSVVGSGVIPGTDGILDLFVGQENGSPALFASGAFSVNGSNNGQRVARWNGTGWTELGGADFSVRALVQLEDGSLYAGGEFLNLGDAVASSLSRWDGTSWSAFEFGTGFNRSVWKMIVFDDGSGPALYATGPFTSVGEVSANRIARYDGTAWSPLSTGLDSWGLALEVFDDGLGGGPALYVGGDFTTAGGVPARRIARWDGTSWSALDEGMDLHLHDLEVFDDGLGGGPALYACGDFQEAGTTPVNHIAKWDGTTWHPLNDGVNSFAIAMKVFDAGSGPMLYVGGLFTQAGIFNVNHIARWNGTSWSQLPGGGLNGGFSPQVDVLEVFDDGLGGGPVLYAGGLFTQAGSGGARNIARWNGTSWSPLGSGVDWVVSSLAAYDEGTGPALYAGGGFIIAGGGPALSIARWNGTAWTPLGNGLGGEASSMAVFGDVLYVGGAFPRVIDTGDSYLGRWAGDTAPTISHPDMVRVRDTGTPGEIVSFTVTATDTCDPTPTLICVPPSGSLFPPGETIVTCTASDSTGHQSTSSFPVFVGKIRRR